jgi:hypothetical protein
MIITVLSAGDAFLVLSLTDSIKFGSQYLSVSLV